jgi:hypothetical protein
LGASHQVALFVVRSRRARRVHDVLRGRLALPAAMWSLFSCIGTVGRIKSEEQEQVLPFFCYSLCFGEPFSLAS